MLLLVKFFIIDYADSAKVVSAPINLFTFIAGMHVIMLGIFISHIYNHIKEKKEKKHEKYFSKNFGNIQPQLVSIVIVTMILLSFTLMVHLKLKKAKIDEAPKGILLFAEQYVGGVDAIFKSVAKNTIRPAAPYIFTLFSFLLVGNLLGLIGLYAPVTSYSVPLVLGLISWLGIYVTGVIYQKIRFFHKFLNPMDFIAQFSPFISISFRIFGNIIGGTTIMYLMYHLIGVIWASLWALVPGMHFVGEVNLLATLLAPPFHIYFDLFSGVVQAFVFTLLTIVYWGVEATHKDTTEKSHKRNRKNKKSIFLNQSQGAHKVRTS